MREFDQFCTHVVENNAVGIIDSDSVYCCLSLGEGGRSVILIIVFGFRRFPGVIVPVLLERVHAYGFVGGFFLLFLIELDNLVRAALPLAFAQNLLDIVMEKSPHARSACLESDCAARCIFAESPWRVHTVR